MSELKDRLLETLVAAREELLLMSEEVVSHKSSPSKWSKKEILGHLVDSAINNLQRFTEVQFQPKPYDIRGYDQDALVAANKYQDDGFKNIVELWWNLNQRIATLMGNTSAETLRFEIITPIGRVADLNYLMTDYIDHLQHHLRQIQK